MLDVLWDQDAGLAFDKLPGATARSLPVDPWYAEKLDEFIRVMSAYGEIDVTRSGLVAVSLEQKKVRLAPPVQKEEGVLQNG